MVPGSTASAPTADRAVTELLADRIGERLPLVFQSSLTERPSGQRAATPPPVVSWPGRSRAGRAAPARCPGPKRRRGPRHLAGGFRQQVTRPLDRTRCRSARAATRAGDRGAPAAGHGPVGAAHGHVRGHAWRLQPRPRVLRPLGGCPRGDRASSSPARASRPAASARRGVGGRFGRCSWPPAPATARRRTRRWRRTGRGPAGQARVDAVRRELLVGVAAPAAPPCPGRSSRRAAGRAGTPRSRSGPRRGGSPRRCAAGGRAPRADAPARSAARRSRCTGRTGRSAIGPASPPGPGIR